VRAHGHVQGVAFRWKTRERAGSLGVDGWVRNLSDGSVEAVFEGDRDRLESLIRWFHEGPRGARVDDVDVTWEEPGGAHGFSIR
jgi:acylphosphatase